ncbi:MAG: hypothetical protein WA459_04010 [Stellaceae bacterium]
MTEGWFPAHLEPMRDRFTALGLLSAKWNATEHKFRQFVSSYLGIVDDDAGPIVLRYFGNTSLTQALVEAAGLRETDDAYRDAINHLAKLFDRCRENRNDVMHSVVVHSGDLDASRLLKPISQNTRAAKVFPFALATLLQVIDGFGTCLEFMYDIDMALQLRRLRGHGGRALLPRDKPPLPDKLPQPAPEAPRTDRRPPLASRK